MAKSIREQALGAIAAALASTGTPAATVTRSQLDQLKQAQLPWYDVTPGPMKITEEDNASVECTLEVKVRAIVDAGLAEGETPSAVVTIDDSALDPLYV